jgi:hypothetical protein
MSTCTSIMLVQWATCTSIMLVQWTNTINIQISLLVYYKVNIIISLNVACSCNDIHVAENCSFWHQATIIHTTIFQLHLCGQHIIPLYPVYQCSSIDVHNLFFFRQIVVSQMLNTFVFHTACTFVYIFDFRFTRLKGTCRYFHLFFHMSLSFYIFIFSETTRPIETPVKTRGELRCSRRVSSSCSTFGTRRVTCYKPGVRCSTCD